MKASKQHRYALQVEWTGNLGRGTSGYRTYAREHTISKEGADVISGSADPVFRGDPRCYNPEELLVGSLSGCHMLWYLHLCAEAGIIVLEYLDQPSGIMEETADGGGRFREVVLRPQIVIAAGGNADRAAVLHEAAHQRCFIANSVNFAVRCEPIVRIAPG